MWVLVCFALLVAVVVVAAVVFVVVVTIVVVILVVWSLLLLLVVVAVVVAVGGAKKPVKLCKTRNKPTSTTDVCVVFAIIYFQHSTSANHGDRS